jgi:hypothetical protein
VGGKKISLTAAIITACLTVFVVSSHGAGIDNLSGQWEEVATLEWVENESGNSNYKMKFTDIDDYHMRLLVLPPDRFIMRETDSSHTGDSYGFVSVDGDALILKFLVGPNETDDLKTKFGFYPDGMLWLEIRKGPNVTHHVLVRK